MYTLSLTLINFKHLRPFTALGMIFYHYQTLTNSLCVWCNVTFQSLLLAFISLTACYTVYIVVYTLQIPFFHYCIYGNGEIINNRG